MNATNNPNPDWNDALIDRGLAEIVGNETPPDLTDRILNAKPHASVTLAEPQHVSLSRAHHWVMFASAACALISLGTFAYMKPSDQLLSRRDKATNNLKDIEVAQSTRQPTTVKLPEFEVIKVAETITVPDGGTFLRGGVKAASEGSENIMLGVTPHIIIQEEEEERLGIASEKQGVSDGRLNLNAAGTRDFSSNLDLPFRQSSFGLDPSATPAAPPTPTAPIAGVPLLEGVPYVQRLFRNTGEGEEKAPALAPQGNMGLEGLINDGYAPPAFAQDAAPAQAESPVVYPAAKEWDELSARRKKYASVDLDGRLVAPGQAEASGPATPTATTSSPYYYEGDYKSKQLAELSDSESLSFDGGGPAMSKEADYAVRAFDGRGQRFRIDAAPADSVDRYAKEPNTQWGMGPYNSGDQYTPIEENDFITAKGGDAVSTFSIDVDTASYANVRQFLEQSAQLPPPDAVRIEELVNYFPYDYKEPTDDTPFAANMEIAACPWNPEHRLARIAIKGKEMDRKARPQSNLVFLIDVSGSMDEPAKLPLLIEGMKAFTRELGENDKVAIVVYASSEGMALPSTRGDQQQTILAALDNLRAGGSTAGGAGIELAYKTATENFIKGGTNRVILCTDGDFNVGVTSTGDLTRLAEQKAKDTKVFLTVLGFGRGNLNDAMMESISGKGNGNYHYVDNLTEARKVLVEEMAGTLVTIAKDVKIQVEFNPAQVAGYRLIGYENRMLATQDFNDDKKDAGEIGAGHTVTALYEIIPAGKSVGTASVDPLKYQPQPPSGLNEDRGGVDTNGDGFGVSRPEVASNELLTLKLRYKLPEADTSTKVEYPITDKGGSFADASDDFQFAAAVASFGMLLRHSQYKGQTSFDAILEIAQGALGNDPHGYRAEFLDLVRAAKNIANR